MTEWTECRYCGSMSMDYKLTEFVSRSWLVPQQNFRTTDSSSDQIRAHQIPIPIFTISTQSYLKCLMAALSTYIGLVAANFNV